MKSDKLLCCYNQRYLGDSYVNPNLNRFRKDVLKAIKKSSHATQTNILRKLEKQYGYHASMFFTDVISELEFEGKIVRMHAGGVTWWESD